MGTLLIRADVGQKIGAGHAMRCLALGQAWQDAGGSVHWASSPEIAALGPRLKAEGMELRVLREAPGGKEDASKTAALARELSASWVAVDGYPFGRDYLRALKEEGLRLLHIDDLRASPPFPADLVLQTGLEPASRSRVRGAPPPEILGGSRHLLLRREFSRWRSWTRPVAPQARKLLVTLGGSDPDNVAGRVLEALIDPRIDSWEVCVVLGPSNPHEPALQSLLRGRRLPIRLERAAEDMGALMEWGDLAISAGGSTGWELAYMGLPALLVILAENQRPVVESLVEGGAAVSLGEAVGLGGPRLLEELGRLALDPRRRAEMSEKARRLVDGRGARRVVAWMGSALLGLREARAEDARVVWEWANDPEVRSASFFPEPIPWDRHVGWFRDKLGNSSCLFYIVTDPAGAPVGQIRYDLDGAEAVISASLERGSRGQGWAGPLLGRACRGVFEKARIDRIDAYIKESNLGSERSFELAGFVRQGPIVMHEQKASHWILKKEPLP